MARFEFTRQDVRHRGGCQCCSGMHDRVIVVNVGNDSHKTELRFCVRCAQAFSQGLHQAARDDRRIVTQTTSDGGIRVEND